MDVLLGGELLGLGLLGGVLTTIAGLGGGLFLVATLGVLRGPHEALAISTPALLLANLHRAILFRRDVDRRVAGAIALGAIPGAIAGGLLLPALPDGLVAALLVVATVFAVLQRRRVSMLSPGRKALALSGGGIGAIAATSGGGGVLVGPVLMAAGLTGSAYVGTVAACGVAIHVGRICGYGLSGLLTQSALPEIALVSIGLLTGNVAGRHLRRHASAQLVMRLEIAALACAAISGVWGVVHGRSPF
ncbi:MAG: sulfite exporter TauE/SafE family protein [Polyangiaceae bacterium]